MAGWAALKTWAPGLLALAVLLSTCQVPGETDDRLPGPWLREYVHGEGQAKRILVLQADGQFRESVRAVTTGGDVLEQVHEGHWFYDGTNLKRKYTLVDGEPPSRLNVPFATFQIEFASRDEFRGVDHVHGNRIHYRRVAAGTQP
jgi:hypothetical protein